jgi:hypothetical protein
MPSISSLFAAKLQGVARSVAIACAVALFARLIIFFYLMAYPLADESGNLVSPLLFQKGADYSFYMQSLEVYQGSFLEIFNRIINTFNAPFTNLYTFVTSGPFLPALFVVFRYSADNTLPLSLASLTVGTLTACFWVAWLHRRGVPLAWLLVFVLLPSPIWYQVNNSLDTYLALFTAVFVFTYMGGGASRGRVAMGLGAGIMAILAKPNGLPLIVFMLADIILNHSTRRWLLKAVFILSAAGLIVVFFLFYMTYLISFLESSSHFSFFGIPYGQYLHGMHYALPAVIDLPLSWLSLIGAKILYLVGLRPSYGITPFEIVAIRAAPGLILLPGLLWLAIKRPHREGLFVLLFLIPPFLGATQERYLLPVMPIVFYCGTLAFGSVRETFLRSFIRSTP